MKPVSLCNVTLVCNRCNPMKCTVTLSINRAAEEIAPTKEIRSVCPMFASRDGYARFERI